MVTRPSGLQMQLMRRGKNTESWRLRGNHDEYNRAKLSDSKMSDSSKNVLFTIDGLSSSAAAVLDGAIAAIIVVRE
jgi:hypothetical protein